MIDKPVSVVDVVAETAAGADLSVRKFMSQFRPRLGLEEKVEFECDGWGQYLIQLFPEMGK